MQVLRLGVNLDHFIAVREARHTSYPDLVEAIRVSERCGADGITLHLREDRRHVQPRDMYLARSLITGLCQTVGEMRAAMDAPRQS